ncbi:MAG: glycosyltransferase, partial [Prevotellaceae bacterium]|nr:glycosyltransferase [Prevotellaceae bacterium]
MNEKKLHILQLPSIYIPHGGQFVRNQAQALQEKGLIVNVLANVGINLRGFRKKYFTLPYFSYISKEDGLEVYRLFTRIIPKLVKWNHIIWAKRTVRLFEKYIKKYGKPDIIHAHFALWGGYAAFLIKQKYGIPYIITEHFSIMSNLCEYSRNKFKNWETPYYSAAYSNADFITPVSKLQIPKIRTFLTKDVPISPVTNVINTDFFYYKERKNDAEKINFVTVNGFYFQKGYDILIPAFDTACKQNPNIELTVVGENFEKKEFQNTLWKKVKHKDKFHFTGELTSDGVRNELWKADCYLMPSRAEGQPQATLEALCTGLPMVCTNVIPDSVAVKENSIMIQMENIELMTEAILKMSDTYKNYDNKSISEHAVNICCKDTFCKEIMKVY